MLRPKYLFWILLAIAPLVWSCGGGGDGDADSDPTKTTRQGISCEKDPELLDEEWSCYTDDDCPCGSSCSYGTCESECEEEADCANGEVCGPFGRCVSPEISGRIERPSPDLAPQLDVSPAGIELSGLGESHQLQMNLSGAEAPRVVVETPEALEVRCGRDGDWQQRCVFEEIAPGEVPSLIEVRLTDPESAPRGSTLELKVLTEDARQVVPVAIPENGQPPELPPNQTGQYEGWARLAAAGFASRSQSDSLPSPLTDLRVPITATVFEGNQGVHPVAIESGGGTLFADETTAAKLQREGAEGWRLEIPARRYAGPDSPGTDDAEIAVTGIGEDIDWSGGRLEFEYRAQLSGVTTAERPLYVDWSVSLTRTADVPEEASAPSDFEPAPPEIEANTRAQAPGPLAESAEEAFQPIYQWSGGAAVDLAQSFYCAPSGASEGVRFGPSVANNSDGATFAGGELACENGEPPRVFGIASAEILDAADTLETCQSDLRHADAIRGGDSTGALTSEGCVDLARMQAILHEGLQFARSRALGGEPGSNPTSTALGLRALQKWLAFQDFFATEAAQIDDLNAVVPDAERVEQTDHAARLDRLVEGWEILLHPRVAFALEGADPDVLEAPDYRTYLFPDRSYDGRYHDQNVGLPVAILDAAHGHTEFLDHVLDEARRHRVDFETVAPKYSELMRRMLAAFALAQGLYDDVRALGEPSWEEDWQLARKNFGAAIAATQRNFAALERGDNPLGIEEVDLPIYRIGDQKDPGERFYAISDFLIGDASLDGGAVAPSLVGRSRDALEAAREAWVANKKRDLREQVRENERERRLETIRREYGNKIVSLCGNPEWTAETILENADSIDPDQCFLADGCRFDQEELYGRISTANLGYDVCIAGELRKAYGSNVSTDDADTDALIDQLHNLQNLSDGDFGFALETIDKSAGIASLSPTDDSGGGDDLYELDLDALASVDFAIPEGIDPDRLLPIHSKCSAFREHARATRPAEPSNSCQTADDCPLGDVCLPDGSCGRGSDAHTDRDPSCYRGTLGDAAFATLGTARDVDAARSELQENRERYDIAMRSCLIARRGNQAREAAMESHNETMEEMGRTADSVRASNWIVEGAKKTKRRSPPVVSAIANLLTRPAKKAQRRKERKYAAKRAIKQAEREHELTLEELENETEERQCFNDAEMHLVGTRTAALKLDRKSLELSHEIVELQELKRELRRTVEQGQRALQNELERTVSPLQIDFWLDEKIDGYDDRFRIAQRAAYLAVRAVEYEFQASLDQRADVLKSTKPSQLEGVLTDLQSYTSTGTVAGGAPDDALTVVSLRDHLLQLADRSNFPEGFKDLPPQQRFRMFLNSPSHAVYDSEGEYLGQELPFSLGPVGSFDHGDAKGVSLLTGTDCAERVWSINASLQGDELYEGSDTTFSRIVLRKRNTFYSQWCASGDRDDEVQVASTRPERNLFVDPYAAEYSKTAATESVGTGSGERGFTNARISAYFNVPRAEMEDESYFNGDSQELAGRGLYGDYALFFPKETLAEDGGNGLRLENIEDVLLRFDYVSVAKN